MRKVRIIILVIVTVLSGIVAFADSHNGERPPMLGKTVILHQKVLSKRPNAPSRNVMECIYGDGFITCIFPEEVPSISIRLYSESEEYFAVISQDNPTMYIPSLSGVYCIECDADNGFIFAGYICF